MHCVRIQLIPYSVKKWNPIECSGFHALLLNAVYYMQRGEMHPVECRGFNAARLNAVDSMQREEMEPY